MFNELFHITDWLPTLLHAAGFPVNLSSIDGMSQWDAISKDVPSQRRELAINIDERVGYSAIIVDQYKLVNGTLLDGKFDHWMGVLDKTEDRPNNLYQESVESCATFSILHSITKTVPHIAAIREDSIVRCPLVAGEKCNPLVAPCLFDLSQDPCEKNNIASVAPHKLSQLLERLNEYQRKMMPMGNKPLDPISNPLYHNNTWEWWMKTTENDRQILKQVEQEIKLEIDLLRQTFGFRQWITTAILIILTGFCIILYCVCSAYRANRYRRK